MDLFFSLLVNYYPSVPRRHCTQVPSHYTPPLIHPHINKQNTHVIKVNYIFGLSIKFAAADQPTR